MLASQAMEKKSLCLELRMRLKLQLIFLSLRGQLSVRTFIVFSSVCVLFKNYTNHPYMYLHNCLAYCVERTFTTSSTFYYPLFISPQVPEVSYKEVPQEEQSPRLHPCSSKHQEPV